MDNVNAFIKQLNHIDSMSGLDFEIYMTKLLRYDGFRNMKRTPPSNDHGLDAYGYNQSGIPIGFQFKNYKHRVPYAAVYETIGGGRFYHTTINIILTNNYYAKKTIRTCRAMNHSEPSKPIYLWDRKKLYDLIVKRYVLQHSSNINIKDVKDQYYQQQHYQERHYYTPKEYKHLYHVFLNDMVNNRYSNSYNDVSFNKSHFNKFSGCLITTFNQHNKNLASYKENIKGIVLFFKPTSVKITLFAKQLIQKYKSKYDVVLCNRQILKDTSKFNDKDAFTIKHEKLITAYEYNIRKYINTNKQQYQTKKSVPNSDLTNNRNTQNDSPVYQFDSSSKVLEKINKQTQSIREDINDLTKHY